MKTSLSEISTVGATFAEDVAAYAAAGFDAIGLWESKLPRDDAGNRALLRDYGLAVASCVPLVPSILPLGIPGMEGPPDVEVRVEALCTSVQRFARYEPECVLCLTGPLGGRREEDARALVKDALREIATAARESGVRLGFEPIHPADRETTSFVNTVADAAALLAEAGLDDVGLMVDTYNLWDDEGAAAWLRANGARVVGLHVADRPSAGTPGRLLPGERGTRSRELVDAAREGGWDGSLDAEIFSAPDGFWALPLAEAAGRAHAAVRALTS